MVDYEKLNWTKTLSKLGKDVLIAERTLGHFLDDDEFRRQMQQRMQAPSQSRPSALIGLTPAVLATAYDWC